MWYTGDSDIGRDIIVVVVEMMVEGEVMDMKDRISSGVRS